MKKKGIQAFEDYVNALKHTSTKSDGETKLSLHEKYILHHYGFCRSSNGPANGAGTGDAVREETKIFTNWIGEWRGEGTMQLGSTVCLLRYVSV